VNLTTSNFSIFRFSALGFGFAFFFKTLRHFTIKMLKLAWATDRRHRVICPWGLVVSYLVPYEYKDITPSISYKPLFTKVDVLFNSAIQIKSCI
jgi:hypothetical protein